MKINKFIFLLAGLLMAWQLKAQTGSTCVTANTLSIVPSQSTGWQTTNLDTLWYSFTATNQNQIYKVETHTSYVKRLTYVLPLINCSLSSITDGAISQNDSTFLIAYGNLTIGQSYKMALVSAINSTCTSCITSTVSNYNITFLTAVSSPPPCTINTCLTAPPCDLVCNGNFETTSSGPVIPSDFAPLCNWDNLLGSCDFFNIGTVNQYSVPCNFHGNENDVTSGNHGYTGFIGFYRTMSPTWIENMGSTLKTTMTAGHTYSVSLKLSLSDDSKYYTDNVGVRLTIGPGGTLLSPTYFNLSTLAKNGWTTYTTSYTALGGEDYIEIGALQTGTMPAIPVRHLYTGTTSTSTCFGYVHPDPSNDGAYYYLDEVSVKDVTTLILTPPTSTICLGSSASITLTNPIASTVYSWTPASSVLSGQGTPSVIVNPTITTTYTVTDGCSTQTAVVYISPNVTLTASASSPTVCSGLSVVLSASGASSYTWQPGSVYSSAFVANPISTTVYTVTGANSIGCTATKTVIVNVVSSIPTITATANQTICAGQTLTLTASGAVSYTWQPGGVTSSSLIIMPTTTTIYTISGTGICGGVASKTISITVIPLPTISITNTLSSLCAATSSGSLTVFNYYVSPTGIVPTWVTTNAVTGATISVPITSGASSATVNLSSYINYTANINFIATVTNTNGCVGSQTITLFACCTPTTGVTKYTNTTFAGGATFTSTVPIIMSGTITVSGTGSLVFINTHVYMDPNTRILLTGTSGINIQQAYMHGCNAMWDGIYAVSTTSNSIQLTSGRIEDAKRAVVDSLGKANLYIVKNYFNKNEIAIQINGTKPSTVSAVVGGNLFTCATISVTPTTWYNTSILPSLTNSAVIGAFPLTTMLPPLNAYNAYCGVRFFSGAIQSGVTNSVITIGTNTISGAYENVFDKLKIGILSAGNLNAQYNVFQNITSSINSRTVFTSATATGAIFTFNFFWPTPFYTNVGGSVATKNTFYNNEYGIYSFGKNTLNVAYNRFDKQTNGVYVLGNNNNSNTTIASNKFIDNTLGVNFDQNSPQINAIVQNNWFDNTVSCGSTASNFAIRFNEVTLSTNPLSFPKYDANNNYINGYYNGIKATQTFSTAIRDNEVHMRLDPTPWSFQFGIQIVAGNNNSVFNNLVDVPSPNTYWWTSGIFTDQSTVPKIHCNTVNNVCYAISANSLNYTTPGNGFYGNLMKNANQGFRLDASGEIGDQYYSTTSFSSDNAWIGCTNETYAGLNCNSTNAKFYTRSAAPYNILSAINGGGTAFNLSGTNIHAASTATCYTGIPTPTLALRMGGAAGMAMLMHKANDIATGTLAFTSYATSLKQIARKQLYSHLALQQIDPAVTTDINSFANSVRLMPIGKFFVIDSLINLGDSIKLNTAKTLNAGVTVVNDVDVTQKQFNSLYILYLQSKSKVTPSTVTDFETIAWLCPTQHGNAVHQARSVLFNITRKRYYNMCEVGNRDIKARIAQPINNTIVLADITVYPNPANDVLFIDANDYSSVDVKLYNIMGELVVEKTIDAATISLDISKLADGVYLYKAYNNGTEIKVGKLIITK